MFRQDLVILSDAGFPDGGCVTGLWVMLRIYACIPHDCRQTIEVLIMVVWCFFCRVASRRCRPHRSPVVRGTRLRRLPVLLHLRKLFLQLCQLLLEGGHVVGGGLLVFEEVFGMVVFGVLNVVADFILKVFVS